MDDTTQVVDPQTHQAVKDYVTQADSGTAATRTQNYAQDMPQARGLLSDSGGFNKGLSYGGEAGNPMQSAIKAKYDAKYSLGERTLQNELQKNGQSDYLKQLQTASDLAGQENALNQKKLALIHKQKLAQKAARGAIVGQALGIVAGAVAGAYTGGAGAAAGYTAGNAAGNAIGGA